MCINADLGEKVGRYRSPNKMNAKFYGVNCFFIAFWRILTNKRKTRTVRQNQYIGKNIEVFERSSVHYKLWVNRVYQDCCSILIYFIPAIVSEKAVGTTTKHVDNLFFLHYCGTKLVKLPACRVWVLSWHLSLDSELDLGLDAEICLRTNGCSCLQLHPRILA